jgi:hypothetical protein
MHFERRALRADNLDLFPLPYKREVEKVQR